MLEQTARKLNFYVSMAFFGPFAIAVNILSWTLALTPRSLRMERFGKRINHWMMRLWMWHLNSTWAMEIDWPEINRLREMRGVVLVANHPSLLDICWVLAASPHITCYIKSDISKNDFYNASARLAGYIQNDSGIDGLHAAVECVRRGDILCVFPEGTRTITPPLNPIKPGFALVAKAAGAPIQTLFIRSNTRCFTKGIFFRAGTLPIRYCVSLGPMIVPHPDDNARDISAKVEAIIRSNLAEKSQPL